MNIEYKRDLNHNYVILQSPGTVDTSTYQVRMILSNDIGGLLHCSIRGVDGHTLYCYDITSMQSLKNVYECKNVQADFLIHLYEQILQVLELMEQFLLNFKDLILLPELIYITPEDDINLCFLPGYDNDIQKELRKLMEYLLPKIDHKDQKAVTAGYGLYRVITEEHCDIAELRSALHLQKNSIAPPEALSNDPVDQEPENLEREKILDDFFSSSDEEEDNSDEKALGVGIGLVLTISIILYKIFSLPLWICILILCLTGGGAVAAYYAESKKRNKGNASSYPLSQKEGPFSFVYSEINSKEEDKDLPPLYGKTELLGNAQPHISPQLIPLSTHTADPIPLNKELVLIGKLSQAVDGIIDSPAVSRIHAKIKKSETGYYIGDLNSRNGTFVNGRPIAGEDEIKLTSGDEVTFADITYRIVF